MNEKEIALNILDRVGSAVNIASAYHCMTRIRLDINDKAKVDLKSLKELKGVIEVRYQGDQLQIVLGKNVSPVWEELQKLISKNEEQQINSVKTAKPKKITMG